MASDTSAENLPTSSNLDVDPPLEVKCFDPDNPDQPCPLCGGLSMLAYGAPYGDPRFGKMYACPNRPVDRARQERLRKLGNLDAYADKSLDQFELARPGYNQSDVQSLTAAYRISQKFALHPEGWILFEGSFGTGKTHLAAAIGNARLAAGDSVMFMTTPDLLDHLRNSYSDRTDSSYDEVFERIKETPLLILDDLGSENPSGWAMEKLFQLLNHRYTRERPTIITTNAELDRLDGRLSSRLRDTNMVSRIKISAPDYRDANAQRNADLLMGLSAYHELTFDNFDVNSGLTAEEGNNLRNAARAAMEYARDPKGWLILTGSYGAGKTHLAASIANYRQQRNETLVTFITMADLLDFLKATFSPDATRNFDEIFDTIRSVELLVLDDLNLDGAKQWTQEKLFQLLDYRYVRRLPTVITTSRSMDDMERSSPRLVSRLIDGRVCRIIGIQARNYGMRMRGR